MVNVTLAVLQPNFHKIKIDFKFSEAPLIKRWKPNEPTLAQKELDTFFQLLDGSGNLITKTLMTEKNKRLLICQNIHTVDTAIVTAKLESSNTSSD